MAPVPVVVVTGPTEEPASPSRRLLFQVGGEQGRCWRKVDRLLGQR